MIPARGARYNGRHMGTPDFEYQTAGELLEAMAARRVSAVELAEAAIARIEQLDGEINAICVRDFDRAREAAREADAARARGEARPLLGVPVTVKESFNIAGLPTTWGMPMFRDFRASADALAVQRMKAAGAVILGKTNVPFALGDVQSYNEIYGTTRNPWNRERTPGGSSGGSSAALAAGFGALSIGSDIGGSLRNPAHYCGVFAHKPTHGLVPSRGHTPPGVPALAGERDMGVTGPMARSADDLIRLLDVMAPPDELLAGVAFQLALPAPRHTSLAGFRVLVIDDHPLMPSARSVRAAIDGLAERLRAAGTEVARSSPLWPDPANAARIYVRLLMSFIAAQWPPPLYDLMRGHAAKLGVDDPSLAAERLRGAALSHRDWVLDDNKRSALREQWRLLFQRFDAVICPVMPTPAFPHDHAGSMEDRAIAIDDVAYPYADQLVWAGVATLVGLPATAVPIARSEDGLPIGVQLIGPMYEDRTPLELARLIERELGGFVPPP